MNTDANLHPYPLPPNWKKCLYVFMCIKDSPHFWTVSTGQKFALHFQLFVTSWTIAQRTRLLCPWDSPGKNTGVGSHFLLQGIFLTQGSNPLASPALAGRFLTTRATRETWPIKIFYTASALPSWQRTLKPKEIAEPQNGKSLGPWTTTQNTCTEVCLCE